MAHFGERSEGNLENVDNALVEVCRFVIQKFDFTVLCGWRGEAEQNRAYPKYTKVKFPNSKHNIMPSMAVDLIPYDAKYGTIVSWTSYEEMAMLAGHMLMAAFALSVELRWGHDWNRNGILWDERGKLVDRPHFELVTKGIVT